MNFFNAPNIWPRFLYTAFSIKGLLCQNFLYLHRESFRDQLDIVNMQKGRYKKKINYICILGKENYIEL